MANWQGFYKLPWQERLQRAAQNKQLNQEQIKLMQDSYSQIGETQVENYLYNFGVPTGLLLELPVDEKIVTVPMATEEPSVIAAANNGAKMMRAGNGIKTEVMQRLIRGQVILVDVADQEALSHYVEKNQKQLLRIANDAHPSMERRGGGAKELLVEQLDETRTIVSILVDPKSAMGANIVNTMAEAVATIFRQQGYTVLMAILSNYSSEALVTVRVEIPVTALQSKDGLAGDIVADRIAQASAIEQLSSYRAVTSNKGLLNGIEAVVLASGNDTRAVNASLHAYASRNGKYQGLVTWSVRDDQLIGETTLPLVVGVVGGSIGIVPAVKLNHSIMGNPTVEELTGIIAGVGLAQNLAAIKALVSTGVQAGHMALQAKSLAVQVGAEPAEIDQLVEQLKKLPRFDATIATDLLAKLRMLK